MTTYSDKLKSPKWQKKRLEILQRDDFACKNCGDKESQLQIHHLAYNSEPWNIENSKLITLCDTCHNEFTKLNFEIKSYLSDINDSETLFQISLFLNIAKNTNPFDISHSIKYLEFIKKSDFKIALSFDSFMEKFKQLNDGQ